MVPLDDIIPALAKIEFHIPHCRPFNDSMCIMPGIRAVNHLVPPQWREELVYVIIPTVEITAEFDQHIDTTDEGMRAVHHYDLLMQRLNRMMDYSVRTVIQDTCHAYLPELLLCRFGIIMQKQLWTGPNQCFHLNTLTHSVTEYCLHGQIVATPEVNLSLL